MAREISQKEADGLCTRPLQKGRILAGRAGKTGCSKRQQPKRGPEAGRMERESGTEVTGLSGVKRVHWGAWDLECPTEAGSSLEGQEHWVV